MAKLFSADIDTNNKSVEMIKRDVESADRLNTALNNFITESQINSSGNGKTLDGEIWNITRDNFNKCIDANNIRKTKATELTNNIDIATKQLRSYMDSAPEPLDPADSDQIPYFDECLTRAQKMYDYYSSHKTKLVGYRYDIWSKQYYPEYDYDQEKIAYWAGQIERFRKILEWLRKLIPTDNSATSLVANVNLSAIKVN